MKRIINILYFILIPLNVFGQLTPVTDHYILNPLSINPAFAGTSGALNIAAFYSRKWTGITGSPETMTLSIDAPLRGNKVGLGFIIINDNIGVTKEMHYSSNYAFKISMGESTLSLGLGAGVITTNTAWSDLVALDPGDEFSLIDSRVFVVPNFSFGMYYSFKNYFAGFSVPKILSYKFDFDKNKYGLVNDPGLYSYMFSTGYLFNSNPDFGFFPSTLLTYTVGNKLLYDINVHFNFNNRFWLGTSYRNDRSVAGIFQLQINSQFKIAYTHDFDLGNVWKYSNGSNEIMLRYEFHYKVDVVNPLVF